MLDTADPLAVFAALEARYDGRVPEPALVLARLGSAARVERLYAEGQAAFFRHLVAGQIRLIRRRRRDGSAYPELLSDLALYRRHWRHWRRALRTLRAAETAPTPFLSAIRREVVDPYRTLQSAGPLAPEGAQPDRFAVCPGGFDRNAIERVVG